MPIADSKKSNGGKIQYFSKFFEINKNPTVEN
jgi:hypothetical protein